MHEHDHDAHPQTFQSGSGRLPQKVKDPVCGMEVDPASAGQQAEYGGAAYYFCSARCKEKFTAGPA
ncbi:MAG TPA: YHS domain-containing protein, partial [Methylocella sp.]|nr:YHS domain-containing protein [Methylocella sp.]